MGGTPDDRAGGITDADLFIANDEGLTPDNAGEWVYKDGSYQFRDSAGVFNPRTGGASFDEKVKVSANDTTSDYLIAKVVGAGGITVTEINDGAAETLEIRTGTRTDDNLRIADTPTAPTQQSSNSWSAVGSLFWDGSSLDGVPTDYVVLWEGWVVQGSADYDVRLVLSTDGTVIGTASLLGNNNNQTVLVINVDESLLPTADDALILQHKSSGGGSGSSIQAGHFLVGRV